EHILALEEGQFHIFSAPVYIRGFVRIYAGILKLNVSQVLSDLDAELAKTERFREPPMLAERPRTPLDGLMFLLSKIKWHFVIPLSLLLVLLGAAIWGAAYWYSRRPNDPFKGLGPGIYKAPDQLRGEFLPLPTNAVHR